MKPSAIYLATLTLCTTVSPVLAQHLLGEPGFNACREAVEVGEASPEYDMFKKWCEHPDVLRRELKGAALEEKKYVNDQRNHSY